MVFLLQLGISYKYKLFSTLNDYVYNLNKPFNFSNLKFSNVLTTNRFFSDIHFSKTRTNKIRLFNLNYKCKHKLLPKLYFDWFTNNIVMLYNVFHVDITPQDVFNKVFNKKHILLENWINAYEN